MQRVEIQRELEKWRERVMVESLNTNHFTKVDGGEEDSFTLTGRKRAESYSSENTDVGYSPFELLKIKRRHFSGSDGVEDCEEDCYTYGEETSGSESVKSSGSIIVVKNNRTSEVKKPESETVGESPVGGVRVLFPEASGFRALCLDDSPVVEGETEQVANIRLDTTHKRRRTGCISRLLDFDSEGEGETEPEQVGETDQEDTHFPFFSRGRFLRRHLPEERET
uniref:Uncharacterized protein n=1 Tax=Mucochytrium quahogii TaxID=96639 RepID=A0A7S2W7Y4_9STRA|mmetsp:Transcript_4257/g.6261  ORF Transcript_4257/g.6261 Transcript_4257/m.6261 type:complete len:224 (+) Transcript_4257:330-1001(+)